MGAGCSAWLGQGQNYSWASIIYVFVGFKIRNAFLETPEFAFTSTEERNIFSNFGARGQNDFRDPIILSDQHFFLQTRSEEKMILPLFLINSVFLENAPS